MSNDEITPFKVAIPSEELEMLRKKLELARLPTNLADAQWPEDNKVTVSLMQETVKFWLQEYDWRREERKINELPQFKTRLSLDEFGLFDVHFVHSKSDAQDPIPLLFIHGWPGSFLEVQKILQPLTSAGFHVVAPSLLGFGFSSYTNKQGLKYFHQADIFHSLMLRLGYERYAVQGGDWGSIVGRSIALRHPENARLLHLNMIISQPPSGHEKLAYSESDVALLARLRAWRENEMAYTRIQLSKPLTLGFAFNDSPVGMLAWMTDKLMLWTDNYPWTPSELITFTLMHYFPGPTQPMVMYRENFPPLGVHPPEVLAGNYVKVPTGLSVFPQEVLVAPRSWVEKENNMVFWKEHTVGGHFAAWEQPDQLVEDLVAFIGQYWKSALSANP